MAILVERRAKNGGIVARCHLVDSKPSRGRVTIGLRGTLSLFVLARSSADKSAVSGTICRSALVKAARMGEVRREGRWELAVVLTIASPWEYSRTVSVYNTV